jgi:predicted DNA-binding protein
MGGQFYVMVQIRLPLELALKLKIRAEKRSLPLTKVVIEAIENGMKEA